MAKPSSTDIESIYQIGVDAGMTRDEVDDIARPHISTNWPGLVRLTNVRSLGELRTIEHLVTAEATRRTAQAPTAQPEVPTTAQPSVTPWQVDRILRLLARHGGGGFYQGPRDRAGISRLTKAQANLYIDSLTDNY